MKKFPNELALKRKVNDLLRDPDVLAYLQDRMKDNLKDEILETKVEDVDKREELYRLSILTDMFVITITGVCLEYQAELPLDYTTEDID